MSLMQNIYFLKIAIFKYFIVQNKKLVYILPSDNIHLQLYFTVYSQRKYRLKINDAMIK